MTRRVPSDARVRALKLVLRRRPSEATDTTADFMENPRGMGRERVGNNPEANTPAILAQRSLKPTLLKLKVITLQLIVFFIVILT